MLGEGGVEGLGEGGVVSNNNHDVRVCVDSRISMRKVEKLLWGRRGFVV